MLADVIEEFGLVYVGAVALALVLAVAAFLLKWSAFGIPMWIVFAVVGVVGALGIVARAIA
jgi:hypothetical protein